MKSYKNNYHILRCIDILVGNTFGFDKHYKSMKKKDKEFFNELPIYNMIKK